MPADKETLKGQESSDTKREADQAAFDRLLAMLDSNREQAATIYLEMRRRLTFYFLKRGCSTVEDLVDETINRVTRKIVEGEDIGDVTRYWYGVARYILKEHWAALGNDDRDLSTIPSRLQPFVDPGEADKQIEDDFLGDRKNKCMRRCFYDMPDEDRRLLIEYVAKGNRENIAALFGMTLSNLRVKVHRLRAKLRKCLDACLRDPPLMKLSEASATNP